MYAGPRPKPFPSVLQGDDPATEAEFARAMADLRREDAEQGVYEDGAEFLPSRAEDCAERALTRMESEVDYHEQILHPPSAPEQCW